MLKFEWNALRMGDKVLVHDSRSTNAALTPGVVEMTDTRQGANGVGIRVAASADAMATVLWPSYMAVHRDPPDPAEPCWQCQSAC